MTINRIEPTEKLSTTAGLGRDQQQSPGQEVCDGRSVGALRRIVPDAAEDAR